MSEGGHLGQLNIRENIRQGDLQTHLQRHIKGVLQRPVVVQTDRCVGG